ncbi:FtsX-like permease family protein [bacterium M00.F.Ca.ET.228.01.1.1]|uniref:ABC transporter permease n=1 Tax=Paraburkholderia phenoliruptrix TaxID=252970 RepID=UPI001093285C|nr:ABC transporter permease [Paraburkholderia phenoliruptrix]TGP45993.1 FtsX-like permease family protein [bacterium M00.F.Ca.ET.228.01.1.1]TGS04094.1 FtsX-like permease family protein [bacterium M00.F.Ca.ET.191.01.1.1]TGU07286.1 FtsX-like permease family protein [bacterium M00.F.Ca.ET.155.01.1.1]MBW0446525.1 ABC transporter permease [Paraburkholderia phenoliruptrix]MBW9097048.1 ABC transporter permease [Paraburkholderia phenoliruptrix]
MAIPLSYIARNLWTRRLTTALTAGGLALVVFVFSTVLMLDAGLKKTLVSTGEENNVVVIRKGAETEVQSAIDRNQANVIEMHPAVAVGGDGRRLASKESVVLISLAKIGSGKPSNVVIRGVSQAGIGLRPQVRLAAGRLFTPGSSEIVVGSSIAKGFAGTQPGEHLRFAQREWTVVGTFDAGGSGFDSEIWGDADQLMQAFRRTSYSSMVVRLAQGDQFERFKSDIDVDPRLADEAKRERTFYSDQSRALSTFLNILGFTLSAIFSIAAMIGAMITMYASVANRVAEIGTLRALGFKRANVLAAFLVEAMLLGLVGGLAGLGCAAFMQFASFSTTNFQTFADLSFRFILTPAIVGKTLAFSVTMGLVGGFLPALRASRMNIVDALRAR